MRNVDCTYKAITNCSVYVSTRLVLSRVNDADNYADTSHTSNTFHFISLCSFHSFVTRVASETVTIHGKVIPANTAVEAPLWYLQHDPEVWEKPYEFDPERFSPENKPSIPPMAFLLFGAGPRNCVGMRYSHDYNRCAHLSGLSVFSFIFYEFAQMEIKVDLVRILQRYRLDTWAKAKYPLTPTLLSSYYV